MEQQLIQKVTVDKAQYHPGEWVKIEIFLKRGILNNITNDNLKVEINDLDYRFYNTEIRLIKADKGGDIRTKKIDFVRSPHNRGEVIRFTVPELKYWGSIDTDIFLLKLLYLVNKVILL